MSATRFYFPAEGSGAPAVSPAFDANWEQTGQATRLKLLQKRTLSTLSTIAANGTRTVPITTTQDILCNQFVSDPLPAQRIDTSCLFSIVIAALESATTANAFIACSVRVCSSDGGTIRGTLFTNFAGGGTEFATTQSTRIFAQTAVTALTIQQGDRLVVEVGAHATSPTAATTYTMRQGDNNAADFALTSALATDLNPWCEFSNDLFSPMPNNYQSVKVGSGMSASGGVR